MSVSKDPVKRELTLLSRKIASRTAAVEVMLFEIKQFQKRISELAKMPAAPPPNLIAATRPAETPKQEWERLISIVMKAQSYTPEVTAAEARVLEIEKLHPELRIK
jgi:hypothetical protein